MHLPNKVTDAPVCSWTLTQATETERPLLANLAQLYLHDFGDFVHDDVEEDGRYRFGWLDRRWGLPGFHQLLLRVAGRPAGFAFVEEAGARPEKDRHLDRQYIAEFGVLRSYRGRGLGAAMARAVFDRFPGPWHIEQLPRNTPAQRFWRRVIADYSGNRFVERLIEHDEVVQLFDSRDRAPAGRPDPPPPLVTPPAQPDDGPPAAAEGAWTLDPATAAERPLLDQFYQYYLHDIVHPDSRDVDESGRFQNDGLDQQRTRPGGHTFVLRVRERPAGFALIDVDRTDSKPDIPRVADLFVVRTHRRRGYGTGLVHALFDRFPGRLEIAQSPGYPATTAFWRHAIATFSGGRFEQMVTEDGHIRLSITNGDEVTR